MRLLHARVRDVALRRSGCASRTPSEGEIEEALQGNLCRCTGYQPIVAAAKAAAHASPEADPLVAERARSWRGSRRSTTARGSTSATGERPGDRAADRRRPRRGARRDAGGDHRRRLDRRRALDHQVHARHLAGRLHRPPRGAAADRGRRRRASRIGAGVSYDDFQAVLDAEFPHLSDYWRRIGGWQVRAMGTVGGNIANGSPIGDTPAGADRARRDRDAAQGRARGARCRSRTSSSPTASRTGSPASSSRRSSCRGPAPGTLNAAYKVTKRRDEDISAVACGFHVALRGRHGRDGAARLRRHGGDPEARGAGRGGAGRPALDAGDGRRAEARARRGLRADHRLARLGGLPGEGRAEPAAPLLPRERPASRCGSTREVAV